jgi:hypothetical protein
MKGYDGQLVVEQIPVATGLNPRLVTKKVCKVCGRRVSKIMYDQTGCPYRRHTERKMDGTKCLHGLTQTDAAGSLYAF